MDATMATNQKITATFKPIGVAGGDTSAQFTGHVEWSSSDPSIVNLVVAAEQLTADAIAQGVVGSVTITATGTDAAGRAFVATGTLTVNPALEITDHADLEFGTPSDQ